MEHEYPKALTAVKARINPTIRTFDFLIPIIKKQNRLFLLRSPLVRFAYLLDHQINHSPFDEYNMGVVRLERVPSLAFSHFIFLILTINTSGTPKYIPMLWYGLFFCDTSFC